MWLGGSNSPCPPPPNKCMCTPHSLIPRDIYTQGGCERGCDSTPLSALHRGEWHLLGSPIYRAGTLPTEPPRQLSRLGSPVYRAGTLPTEPPRQLSRLGSPAHWAGTLPTEPPRQLSRLRSPVYHYPLSQ